jgi:hypothetical protein
MLEDGLIWICGLGDESIMAFTRFGVESLTNQIHTARCARRWPRAARFCRAALVGRVPVNWEYREKGTGALPRGFPESHYGSIAVVARSGLKISNLLSNHLWNGGPIDFMAGAGSKRGNEARG